MTKTTYAFFLQSAISFGAAFIFVVGGIYFLPWTGGSGPSCAWAPSTW